MAGDKRKARGAGTVLAVLLIFALTVSGFSPVSEAAENAQNCSAVTASYDSANLTGLSDWPEAPSIEGDAGILIDAHTGNILYAKDINTQYYPASITKILTTLIVCEQGNPDDIITFSHNAIYGIPSDSSVAGFSEGEQVTVEDAMYGLMLASGNEVAVALAEYIAGSVEDFAVLMNKRAEEAGATNSNFVNPHGYTDPDHYTTCHDMAMIMMAAIQNEEFLKIASTVTYTIGPTNRNENGYTFTAGHQMINKNRDVYYEYAVAGKTGFTSQAGNTLVTYAKNGDLELICVVMHTNSTHYSDTRLILDYGFDNFTCFNASVVDEAYNSTGIGFFSFLSAAFQSAAVTAELDDCYITVPNGVSIEDLSSTLAYADGSEEEDANVLGHVTYTYEGQAVGEAALRLLSNAMEDADESGEIEDGETEKATENTTTESEKTVITINIWYVVGGIIGLILLALIVRFLVFYFSAGQRRKRRLRRAKQQHGRFAGTSAGSSSASAHGRRRSRRRRR